MTTTIPDLEQRIKAKANEETQKDIQTFVHAVKTAAVKLYCRDVGVGTETFNEVMQTLMTPYGKRKWAAELWRTREDAMRQSIINQYDWLQKFLRVTETVDNPEQMEGDVG